MKTKTPYSNIEIAEIKSIAEKNDVNFLLAVIPMWEDKKFLMPQDVPDLFSELKYHVPPVHKKHYHDFNDGHYNDAGHAMHADFLDSLIKAQERRKELKEN